MNPTAPNSDRHASASPARIGLVAIGRNEGQRLRACLESARNANLVLVYVDSGSNDNSTQLARDLGAIVVDLDLSKPFTAARARNEGFEALIEHHPRLDYVQFVDGDCQLQPDWIETASAFLDAHPEYAVACGRRRERFPDATIYNKLCDLEWNTPIGDALSCGGDALIRVSAFKAVGGYNPTVIAGEEPEMCVRLRALGHRIRRLDAEMTLHDAAMTRFGQWWKRNVRAGHAFAEGFHRHGRPPEQMWRKSVRSNYLWTILFPLWPLLWLKVLRQGRGPLYATFITLSKIPQTLGQLKFHYNRLTGSHQRIIEYK